MPRRNLIIYCVLCAVGVVWLVYTERIHRRGELDAPIQHDHDPAISRPRFAPSADEDEFENEEDYDKYQQHPVSSPVIITKPEPEYFENDGLLHVSLANLDKQPRLHPILHLIRKSKEQWQHKLSTQSQTLAEAVQEYRRRYGRPPPKGFDQWFKFAQDNHVLLKDNYDQINRDILPFLGLPSELLRKRTAMTVNPSDHASQYYHDGSFTLHIQNGKVAKVSGPNPDNSRIKEQLELIEPFVEFLPDFNASFWYHDTPVIHTAGERRQQLEELARQGETLEKEDWDNFHDPPEFVGWEAACPPNSKIRQYQSGLHNGQADSNDPSFISDAYEAADMCRHPHDIRLHALTSAYGNGPRMVDYWPLFSQSKMPGLYSDILVTPLEQWNAELGPDPNWEDKQYETLLWRGSNTGASYTRESAWRRSQRSRLLNLANVQDPNIYQTLLKAEPSTGAIKPFNVSLASLAPKFFDVAFSGSAIQCSEDCGAVERVHRFAPFKSSAEQNQHKYQADIDGNGWSGRFHRLLRSKSCILKSTGFMEWYSDRIQPWVHYVPVKLDYSDLYDIMLFFRGSDDSGRDGHEALAKEIGESGRQWALRHWRMEDMQAYMFRLYLEYARLLGDREGGNMDFHLSEDEPKSGENIFGDEEEEEEEM